jgi:hypothetical protein
MLSITDIFENYKSYIESNSPVHFAGLCKRVKNNPESARAEAVIFSMLYSNGLTVENHEDPSHGGPDFICRSNAYNFFVEVSCLQINSVVKSSSIPNEALKKSAAFTYNLITNLLRSKASSKVKQLSSKKLPRILAITTEHSSADILMGSMAAESLLVSDQKIAVTLNQSESAFELFSDLKESVFFRFSANGSIEPCRQSISAILLVQIFPTECRVVGILNPVPSVEFDIQLLPNIPFVRVNSWPIQQNRIKTEWVIHDPDPRRFFYTFGLRTTNKTTLINRICKRIKRAQGGF